MGTGALGTVKPMSVLSAEQQRRALEVMREYLAAPPGPNGQTPFEAQADLDRKRVELIDSDLAPLLDSYLSGRTAPPDFKSKIDGINKRNEYWGFKGIKGQMFFNMVANISADEADYDQEIKAAIAGSVLNNLCIRACKS